MLYQKIGNTGDEEVQGEANATATNKSDENPAESRMPGQPPYKPEEQYIKPWMYVAFGLILGLMLLIAVNK